MVTSSFGVMFTPDQETCAAELLRVCRSGGRSLNACRFALASGREAVNVTGGMLAWSGAGLDVVDGA